MSGPVGVLIADDDPRSRAGLRTALSAAVDLRVVGEAGEGDQVVPLVERHDPDVVLMDIRMPAWDGLAATRTLRARPDPPEVIVLTGRDTGDTGDTDADVLGALRAGAAGFLRKDAPPEELVTAVRRVARGQPVLSAAVTRRLVARVSAADRDRRRAVARARLASLNAREHAVAVAVGQGRTDREIAALLYLSGPAVQAHLSGILARLGLNNRVQIALLAHDAGLLED
ncbi:response regulator transcription factor [Acrocarpospora phusangensis]|nr:response regulator transcription factor [Acrocarpospora phusangensis]